MASFSLTPKMQNRKTQIDRDRVYPSGIGEFSRQFLLNFWPLPHWSNRSARSLKSNRAPRALSLTQGKHDSQNRHGCKRKMTIWIIIFLTLFALQKLHRVQFFSRWYRRPPHKCTSCTFDFDFSRLSLHKLHNTHKSDESLLRRLRGQTQKPYFWHNSPIFRPNALALHFL